MPKNPCVGKVITRVRLFIRDLFIRGLISKLIKYTCTNRKTWSSLLNSFNKIIIMETVEESPAVSQSHTWHISTFY